MTASAGFQGHLKQGSNVIGEVKKVDFGRDADMFDTTIMTGYGGSNARTFIPGLTKASCKVDANLDMGDTNGQLALWNGQTTGTLFTITLLTGVTITSAFSFDAYVKNFNPKFDVGAEEQLSFEMQPTGDVSWTA